MKKNKVPYFLPFTDHPVYPHFFIAISFGINMQDDHEHIPTLNNVTNFLNF